MTDVTPAEREVVALREQVAALRELVEQQAAEADQQQQQQPQQQQRQPQTSRFARKEPRAQDLREYDGNDGSKLDTWLDELGAAVDLFELTPQETVRFGASRLRGAARLWWNALGQNGKAAINNADALTAALRTRFQPVTTGKVARIQLDQLQQGNRHINDYIADFQRIHASLPKMDEQDAIHAFERGLRADLAVKLREHAVETVAAAIALAARIGGLTAATATNPHGRPAAAAVNQMDIDAGGIQQLVNTAVLNALRMQSIDGGASERGGRGHRGRRSFGGRAAGRRPPPNIPGVPSNIVQQRWDAKQCLRCGAADHLALSCPNAISASGQGK
jgi:hypothetical protein